MHNELRYQAKIHAISDMPKKIKFLHLLPQFFLKIKIKTCYKGKKTLITLACRKIKPVFKEKGSKLPIQKNSCPMCFSCLPQIVPATFSQEQQEK
jgi:TPP-dependent indolepyruvate ferredoxin oxidoreductase alpha subunit